MWHACVDKAKPGWAVNLQAEATGWQATCKVHSYKPLLSTHALCWLQETCLILPRCKLALDIGRCPQPSVFQQTVLITHGHLDHIGGVTFHAASR
jgi:hypothetical protein